MSRSKGSSRELRVYLNHLLVGTLARASNGSLSFTYAEAWVARLPTLPISRSLPLRPEPYSGDTVRWYFENLLPDERGVREHLASRLKARSADVFDLLEKAGRDCVGALQFLGEGESEPKKRSLEADPLKEVQIAELLTSLQSAPLGSGWGEHEELRISIAGAQDKTALTRLKNKWHRPRGSTPTTHILKPPIGIINGGPDLSLSVECEWLSMEICRAFDLPTAETEILSFKGQKALVVTRFDRKISDDSILRLPQEDFCQMMGLPTSKKYESDGGPGIARILEMLNESDHRDEDRRYFMKSQIVFWLLAAIDGHAKNFSTFMTPSGFRLTPLYDVMSVDPFIGPTHFSERKIKLAMAVGDGRHSLVQEIQKRHWIQSGDKAKFGEGEVEALLSEISDQVPGVIATVEKRIPKEFPDRVVSPIIEGLKKRAQRLCD